MTSLPSKNTSSDASAPLPQRDYLHEDPLEIIKDSAPPSNAAPPISQGLPSGEAQGDPKPRDSPVDDIDPNTSQHDGPTDEPTDLPSTTQTDADSSEENCDDKSRGKGGCHVPRAKDPRKEEDDTTKHSRHDLQPGSRDQVDRDQVDGGSHADEAEPESLNDVSPSRRSSKVRPAEGVLPQEQTDQVQEPTNVAQVDGPGPADIAQDTDDDESSDPDLITFASRPPKDGKTGDLGSHPDGDEQLPQCVMPSHTGQQVDGSDRDEEQNKKDDEEDSKIKSPRPYLPPPDIRRSLGEKDSRPANGQTDGPSDDREESTTAVVSSDQQEKDIDAAESPSRTEGTSQRASSQVDGQCCPDGAEDEHENDPVTNEAKCSASADCPDCADGKTCGRYPAKTANHRSQVDGNCCPDGASDEKTDDSSSTSPSDKKSRAGDAEPSEKMKCDEDTSCSADNKEKKAYSSHTKLGDDCQASCDGASDEKTDTPASTSCSGKKRCGGDAKCLDDMECDVDTSSSVDEKDKKATSSNPTSGDSANDEKTDSSTSTSRFDKKKGTGGDTESADEKCDECTDCSAATKEKQASSSDPSSGDGASDEKTDDAALTSHSDKETSSGDNANSSDEKCDECIDCPTATKEKQASSSDSKSGTGCQASCDGASDSKTEDVTSTSNGGAKSPDEERDECINCPTTAKEKQNTSSGPKSDDDCQSCDGCSERTTGATGKDLDQGHDVNQSDEPRAPATGEELEVDASGKPLAKAQGTPVGPPNPADEPCYIAGKPKKGCDRLGDQA